MILLLVFRIPNFVNIIGTQRASLVHKLQIVAHSIRIFLGFIEEVAKIGSKQVSNMKAA